MAWKRDAMEVAVGLAGRLAPRARQLPAEPESIFVLRNNDLGDLLVATPLFAALRGQFPHARIIAGVGSWAATILDHNPYIDQVLRLDAPWHNQQVRPQGLLAGLRYIARAPEVRTLTLEKCTVGIDVLGSPFGSLLFMRAGIPWRLGVRGYAGGHSAAQQCVEFDEAEHVGRSALRFAELLGATDLPENRPQLFFPSPPAANGAVIVAPGGGFAAKCWPESSFAALLDQLAPRRAILIGGPQDRPMTARLARNRPHVEDRAGQYSLREAFALIAGADAVVCNSSMAMHAAAAFRKPCLVLLGAHFTDAGLHATQWGYPETRVLGSSREHPRVWSPKEAWPVLASLLSR